MLSFLHIINIKIINDIHCFSTTSSKSTMYFTYTEHLTSDTWLVAATMNRAGLTHV